VRRTFPAGSFRRALLAYDLSPYVGREDLLVGRSTSKRRLAGATREPSTYGSMTIQPRRWQFSGEFSTDLRTVHLSADGLAFGR